MAEPSPSELGTVAGRVWASAFEGLHLRLELLALELGDERRRLTGGLLLAVVAVLAGFMGLVSMNVALLALYWDTHRVGIAVGSCIVYVLLAAGAALALKRRSRRASAPFATLAKVLADDERALRDLL